LVESEKILITAALPIKSQDADDYFATMRRCTSCILPETFPGIEFDEYGVCNYCETYEKIQVKGESELEKELSKYRNKDEKYDCLVPISGGRDSSFVLHQIVRKYNMRVLAATVDSGAILPEGYRNIQKVTDALDVEHVWIKDDKHIETSKENAKIKFHAWLEKPSINTIVPVLNASDKQMNLRLFKCAHEHRIPLVLGGNNIGNSTFEQEHFKTGFMGVFPNERGYYSTIDKTRLALRFGWEFARNRHNYHWSIFREYLGGAFVYFFESIQKPDDVTPLGYYDYVYWNEKEVLATVFNELGWQGASDTTATWRIDDSAYPLIDYMYLKLVGFNEFAEFYSKLIREGQISREDALKRCMSDGAPRIPSLMRMLEELGVAKEEVDDVLNKYRIGLLKKILKGRPPLFEDESSVPA
jgi:hypothetical protein